MEMSIELALDIDLIGVLCHRAQRGISSRFKCELEAKSTLVVAVAIIFLRPIAKSAGNIMPSINGHSSLRNVEALHIRVLNR